MPILFSRFRYTYILYFICANVAFYTLLQPVDNIFLPKDLYLLNRLYIRNWRKKYILLFKIENLFIFAFRPKFELPISATLFFMIFDLLH